MSSPTPAVANSPPATREKYSIPTARTNGSANGSQIARSRLVLPGMSWSEMSPGHPIRYGLGLGHVVIAVPVQILCGDCAGGTVRCAVVI